MKRDDKTYDLSLGKWGPYNKKYLGICRIDNPKLGSVFCAELFPGFYRRSVIVSPTVSDGAVKMWGANARLTYFCYRYELEWKDRVYCDAHFTVTDDRKVRIDCEFVNNTDCAQNLSLNLCAGMRLPRANTVKSHIMDGCTLIDAADYDEIHGVSGIAQDGKYLGETQLDGASAYGTAIRCGSGVTVVYKPVCAADSLGVRFCAPSGGEISVTVNGEKYVLIAAADGFGYGAIGFEQCTAERIEISAECEVFIDCLVIGHGAENCAFEQCRADFEPTEREVTADGIRLRYADSDCVYRLIWDSEPLAVRQLFAEDEGLLLQQYLHNHVSLRFRAENDSGAWENIFAQPVYLAPRESRTVGFTLVSEECGAQSTTGETKTASSSVYRVQCNSDGDKYAFSQNIMAYTTLLNVVYPIYSRRGYIRHNTPGRNWDSLYSWDSGFIGMGLATVDFDRAFDCLNAYLTPAGDIHSPYIFHGSVVPTQVFLYAELADRFFDDEEKRRKLKNIYPMMRQYYDFYSSLHADGHQVGSGLLKTWHIFYNSGGWDDYPPQTAVHANSRNGKKGNTDDTTPVITTACVVLIAKIMRKLAKKFAADDTTRFDADIARYSAVIEDNLWDDDVGYYSYMIHDENGSPRAFLRFDDGTNYNCGFDGIYPYIAGTADEYRRGRIIGNIRDGLMTDFGVGAVDTRAPYYSDSGYWNGSVWMPHQWILWKSLLDNGEANLAAEIAEKAVKTWSAEVCESYSCFENFTVRSGRGSGYHAFSGLSTPVLMFFESLYRPGSVTVGFLSFVESRRFSDDNTRAEIIVNGGSYNAAAIVCMNGDFEYEFAIGGKAADIQRLSGGAYFVRLNGCGKVVIEVNKK